MMNARTTEIFFCAICNNKLEPSATFCGVCGSLFDENALCTNHRTQWAQAVCIICSEAYCADCVVWVNDHFLCGRHASAEIQESVARVHDAKAVSYVNAKYAVKKSVNINA